MKDAALIYPMLAMVALTAYVLSVLFRRRTRAVKEGRVSSRYFRVFQGETEPNDAAKATRHFANLFEAPVLFYVACVTAIPLCRWVQRPDKPWFIFGRGGAIQRWET